MVGFRERPARLVGPFFQDASDYERSSLIVFGDRGHWHFPKSALRDRLES